MKNFKNLTQSERCELFGCLIDTVEDWLEMKGITTANISNDEREDEDSAIIYGSDYDYLADRFSEILGIDRDVPEICEPQAEVLTAGVMREIIGDRNIPVLASLVEGKADSTYLNLIDRDDYFASKIWCEEDIATVLIENGYEDTEDNIQAVLGTGMLKVLNDCTDQDWQVITNAVEAAME